MLTRFRALSTTIAFVAVLLMSASCVKPEAPNAEADILDVTFEGIDVTKPIQITNNTVTVTLTNGWEDLSKITPHFTLTEGASISPHNDTPQDFTKPVQYQVTSEDGNWTKSYTVKFVSPIEAPAKHSFERAILQGDLFPAFVENDKEEVPSVWNTPNIGFYFTGMAKAPEDFPVMQGQNGYVGKCAVLTTKSTGDLGLGQGKPIAAGSLFTGIIDPSFILFEALKATQFGIPVHKKPLAMTGYYKYKSGDVVTDSEMKPVEGKKDIFDLYAVMFEVTDKVKHLDGTNSLTSPNIVSIARIKNPTEASEWTRFEVKFEPKNGKTIDPEKLAKDGYSFAIIMSSSRDGAQFIGAVGSTLMVDELEIFYEK